MQIKQLADCFVTRNTFNDIHLVNNEEDTDGDGHGNKTDGAECEEISKYMGLNNFFEQTF